MAESSSRPVPSSPSSLAEAVVLYVEDDELVRNGLSRFLERRVAALHIAADGAAGLERFRELRPDIVLTDVMMPVMNGLEMTARIRELDGEVPVVVTTAFNEQNLLIESINAGVDQYVLKPINTRQLLDALEKVAATVRARRQLEARNEELRLAARVFESTDEAILITDPAAAVVKVNRAFELITGYTAAEVMGHNPRMLGSGQHDTAFFAHMWSRLNKAGHWQGEISNRRKNGEIYPQWTTISVVRAEDGGVSHYVAVFSDISQRRDIEERIEHLAYYDALTDLPNRVLLQDRFGQVVARSREGEEPRGALLLLDLDRFKKINDSLGMTLGDAVLKKVAERLLHDLPPSVTVARLGGDEYVVFLPSLDDDPAAIVNLAKKVADSISAPIRIEGTTLSLTFSLGISVYPDDGTDLDTLLRNADSAMYEAKAGGRDTYRFFKPEMNSRLLEQLHMEADINRALSNGEFLLHYQPLLALDSGRILGFEALVRWESPDAGLVSPASFIPLAEETGQILHLGAWVLREACRQLKCWHDAGHGHLVVAVNLSAVQFKADAGIEALIDQVAAETGVDLGRVELELTESVVMHNAEDIIATLQRLKDRGCRLVIDDFGTGYSNMSYLKRFPVDKLKIDKSFVRDISDDPTDLAICRAIIALGHSISLQVLAEGVETRDQLLKLRSAGCDEMQGFWFSRPLPAAEAEALLEKGGFTI